MLKARFSFGMWTAFTCIPCVAQLGTEHIITNSSQHLEDFHIVDLDGDGQEDLVGLHYDLFVSVRVNEGNGQFSSNSTIIGFSVFSMAPGDLDSDGDVDIVAAVGEGQPQLGWYENMGQGELAAFAPLDEPTVMFRPYLTDVDLDGDIDVLGSFGMGLGLYLNNGAQVFSSLSPTIPVQGSVCNLTVMDPTIFADIDLDGDGDRDLLVGDGTCPNTYWVENSGGGVFSTAHLISEENIDPVARAMDLDQDGDQDVILSDYDRVLLFENNGIGTFTLVEEVSSPENDHFAGFVMYDMDADGDLDVIKSNGVFINWVERTGPLDLGDFQTGVPIPPGGPVYFGLADIGWSSAPELFYSNSNSRVAYFGDEGSALSVPQNTRPPQAMIVSRSINGAYLHLPGLNYRIDQASAWALSGAEIGLRATTSDIGLFLGDLTQGIYVLSVQSEKGLERLRLILLD